ncbi:MAG: MATE family efflux transporter [Eubacteriales bacterium]|nr:MATE family efflux transporter [Eubacteriales bacterium]MDD3880703.1 MATE family efflux transporter [Eubacteriales bacterium]MDD4511663.1 MATE family efflux transporter [Eubacteriales bacterium]
MRRSAFPWKSFLKSLAIIAVPVALQNLLTTTGSMVDTMMIGSLGENYVGAVGLCAQFSSLMFACYWGFVGGGMLFFAQFWGAKDDAGINRSYGMTLSCMMVTATVFCALGLFAPEFVMQVYTDKAPIQAIGIEYLRIVALAYPLQIWAMAMSALLRSTERVRIPLYGGISAVITNMALNWLLIYGNLGFPRLGVKGAAIATVCSSAVNVLVIALLAKKAKFPYLTSIRSHFRWGNGAMKAYLVKCFPIICNELLVGVGNMVINIVLGRQSEQAIAATAVFRTFEGLIIGFFSGFSNAASVLVGKEVGAGNLDTAYERAKRLVYLCSDRIASVCLILILVRQPLLTAMSLHDESYAIGSGMLFVYSVAALLRMCNWAQNDTFRSAGDSVYGTVLEIAFMYAVVLPCVWLSGMVVKAPFLVVFALCYADEPIRFVLMQRHLYSGKWIKPVTDSGRAALCAFREKRGIKPKGIRA